MRPVATDGGPSLLPSRSARRDRSARHRRLRGFRTLGWLAILALAWVVVSIALHATTIVRVTVLAQSLVPLIFLPVWIAAGFALWRRDWSFAAACVALVIAQAALVLPAVGSDAVPRWADHAPAITIVAVNVWDENPTPNAAARRLAASHADVLVLVEVANSMQRALERAGIDRRFPYQLKAVASRNGTNDGIYSRLPLEHPTLVHDVLNELPAATVTRGGRTLRIIAVHIDGPLHGRTQWQAELADLESVARAQSGPLAIVGDFNATRWNPPFRDLLDAHLTDAHESRGQGLSRSWPVRGSAFAVFGPLMRLDHALTNSDAVATNIHDVNIPGSDHAGFQVRVAMKRA